MSGTLTATDVLGNLFEASMIGDKVTWRVLSDFAVFAARELSSIKQMPPSAIVPCKRLRLSA
jgi:hypothetical protein